MGWVNKSVWIDDDTFNRHGDIFIRRLIRKEKIRRILNR
jgi:hypothetical protein